MTSFSEKRKWVYPSILAMAVMAMIYLLFENSSTRKMVQQINEEKEYAQFQAEGMRSLLNLDTLLLNNQFDQAQSVINNLNLSVSDSVFNEALIRHQAVISQMQKNWRAAQTRPALPNIDRPDQSLKRPVADPDASINADSLRELQNELDSMAFALQKAELFANKLQVQVDENTAGNYLSFNSRKGNRINYVGDIKDGKANGTGVGLLSTGSRFEGQWKNNQKHGKGIFEWQDGARYDGEYQNDLRHGIGSYHWPNGEWFEGEWENDVRSGEGSFYGKDGKMVATGLWRDDELVQRKKEKE